MSDNVEQAVPFFDVRSMADSLGFYVHGLGFEMKDRWVEDGVLRWCWLQSGGAALMLQEARPGHWDASVARGAGVTIFFVCKDALSIYRAAREAGLDPTEPFVGNSCWVTSLRDPDGYRVEFESATEVAEGTKLSEVESGPPEPAGAGAEEKESDG